MNFISKRFIRLGLLPLCRFQSTIPAAAVTALRSGGKRQLLRPVREWNIWAYPTAKNYPLKNLKRFVEDENSYTVKPFGPVELHDSVCLLKIKSSDDASCRDFFVFDEGAIVFWNCNVDERLKAIATFYRFADSPLDNETIEESKEKLFYIVDETIVNTHFTRKPYEDLYLKSFKDDDDSLLERFTVSHAMVASVKLSVHESTLEHVTERLPPRIDSMKKGKINLTKKQLFEISGNLFELRYKTSLDSDLLEDAPDFYWDRESLGNIYGQAYRLLNLEKRTSVMNEKLNYCFEFAERMHSQLEAEHSHKLERYIIYLIVVEVIFGFLLVISEYKLFLLEHNIEKISNETTTDK